MVRAMLPAMLAMMDVAADAMKNDPEIAAGICKKFDANGCVNECIFLVLACKFMLTHIFVFPCVV
jgi:hypothetical protein